MGILHVNPPTTDVHCPKCNFSFDAAKYGNRLKKRSWTGIICGRCKKKIGLTSDMAGDLVAFEFIKERKKVRP